MAERQKLEAGMQTVTELETEAADGMELLELAESGTGSTSIGRS